MLQQILSLRFSITLAVGLSLAGCINWQTDVKLPPPLPVPSKESNAGLPQGTTGEIPATSATKRRPAIATAPTQTRFTQTPGTALPPSIAGMSTYEEKIPGLTGGPFTLDVDNLPLPAFINEVYGNMLRISYQIDKTLQNSRDLITVRLTQPHSAEDLARVATKILAEYGVAIKKEQDHYRFMQSSSTPLEEPPLLISGRTLPEVPVTHRPIFQVVPLYHVRNTTVTGALRQIYTGQDLKITEDPERNALMLEGPKSIIAHALETIQFLDQPSMRGRYSLRIDPLYQTPEALSEALVQVLQSEGYGASSTLPMGSILVLPMTKINTILVFTAEQTILRHIEEWAQALDRPSTAAKQNALFYYQVKNTSAGELVKTLTPLVPGIAAEHPAQTLKSPSDAPATAPSTGLAKSNFVVDEQRNAILFFGYAETWSQLLPVIRQMDTQSKQVMIEVTIAEITLGDTDKFGIEWIVGGKVGQFNFDAGTLVGAATPVAGAFNFFVNTGGQTRLVLNALATDNRVNVLSTPRLMVKSGDEASIEIGTEVPIVTSQGVPSGAPQTGGDSLFTQNIQYRKTGVLLNIKPVIHSGRRIDLELSQELSAAQANTTSDISSPTILNRKVDTTLSLKDGASVLLAGIISDNSSYDSSGIPYLKDIPLFGQLFSTRARSHDKSEIVVMITPYIMEQDADVEAISEALRNRYTFERPVTNTELKHE